MNLQALVTATFSGVLDRLLPDYQRRTGVVVERWDGTAGHVRDKLIGGTPADLAFVTASVIDAIEKSNRLAAGTLVEVARSPVGVAIRQGAPKPDLSSTDALKRLILSARSIALTDPNGGGNTGRFFTALADKLGVGEELRAKTRLYRHGGHVSEGVAAGEADFGITVISEIVPIAGAAVGGPLPKEVENVSITYAAIVEGTHHRAEAQALIAFLTSPAAAGVIRDCGMEPPRG